jgi:hypothetical protein
MIVFVAYRVYTRIKGISHFNHVVVILSTSIISQLYSHTHVATGEALHMDPHPARRKLDD